MFKGIAISIIIISFQLGNNTKEENFQFSNHILDISHGKLPSIWKVILERNNPFEINNDTHFHVPITLSPLEYSTYSSS